MRNNFKGLVNDDQCVLHHGRSQEHCVKSLFLCQNRIAPLGDMFNSQTLQILQDQFLRLVTGQIFMIFLNQRYVHIHILVGKQRKIKRNRGSLQRMFQQELLKRVCKSLFVIKIIQNNFVMNDSTSIIIMAAKTLSMPCETTTGILVSSLDARSPKRMGINVMKNP